MFKCGSGRVGFYILALTARAKAWCPLIHAEASLTLSRVEYAWFQH